MRSTWSSRLSLTIFGESHGPAIGMTLTGLPPGVEIDLEELQAFLNRRAPGRGPWATKRKEGDQPEFLSGLLNGVTTGAPLCAIIPNENTRSQDYDNLRDVPRPGHADYTAAVKYGGFQDVSGGGHFSGRLTAPLCIAGGICLQLLRRRGIHIAAHIAAIGGIWDRPFDPVKLSEKSLAELAERDFPVLHEEAGQRMQGAIEEARLEQDSLGGVIECVAIGIPPGLGDPIFDGMENRIARLVFGIPAVKGVEFGVGFAGASLRGSEHNDPFYWDEGVVKTRSNHHGGILGGITSGMPLLFRAAVKPTPSIAREQESVSLSRREGASLSIKGRHDPCIVPRAVPCMEAAAALAIVDAILEQEGLLGTRGVIS